MTRWTNLKIPYEQVDNDPAASMEECAAIDKAIGTQIRKNVFFMQPEKDDLLSAGNACGQGV